MMIFGFNTDVKCGDTVFHVQSEPRDGERILQTQVFVRGHCIGKRATYYGDLAANASFGEEQLHEMLKAQHRQVLDAARAGRLAELLAEPAKAADSSTLLLEWLNGDTAYAGNALIVRLRVTDAGTGVAGATVMSRVSIAEGPLYAQAITDSDGEAEMRMMMKESELGDAAVLVQASFQGRSATRKFKLKKAER